MRRALINFFFGIPERSTDSHFHQSETLRIGAKLINQHGEELWCYRRKGRKATLLDENNRAIDESSLQLFLDGMNEAQFIALFCFDHERLRQGGEDLLQGGGHVGESLFGAATGNSKIHDVLAELDQEKDELFKARGTKPLLNQTIKSYKDACKRIKDCSLSATQWSEHAKKLDEAQRRHTQLTEQIQTLRTEQRRLERTRQTRPLLQRHQQWQAELVTLSQVIILPDDAAANHLQVKLALRSAQIQEQQALQDINLLTAQINATHISEPLLAQKAMIDDLRGRLGSHQKAARDLPGVRTEMRTVENEALALLQRLYPQLGLTDVASQLAVTTPQREHIKRLAEQYPIFQEQYRHLANRLKELQEQLEWQQEALARLPLPPDLTILRVALARTYKYGNLEDLQAKDEQEVHLLQEKAEINLKQLGLWNGKLEDLESIALPRLERIDHFERRFKESENDQQRIKEKLLEARRQNDNATKKINALRWAGEVPTEEALQQARQLRQQYWQPLKSGPTAAHLYRAFEEAMLQVDDIADRLRREAHRVAEYSGLLAERDSAQHELELQTKKWHKSNELLTNLQLEWDNCWQPLGIKPWAPLEMRTWLTECLNLRQQISTLRERRQQLKARQQLIMELLQELNSALIQVKYQPQVLTRGGKKTEVKPRLGELIVQGETWIAEMMQLQRQRENFQQEITKLLKEIQHAEAQQEQVHNSINHWQEEWANALKPLKLAPNTPPETVRNVLNDLDQVLNKIDKANGLRRRVELMHRDAEIFRQDVVALAQKIAAELVKEPVEYIIPELSNRLNQAEKNVTRYEQLQQRLQVEQQRLANATQQVQLSQVHLQALLEQAHCGDLTSLETAEQASLRKKELLQNLQQIEKQLLEQGEGLSLTELAEAVAGVDIEQLTAQWQQCKEQLQNLEQERSAIDQHIGELRTLLKQMDGNAAAASAADEAQLTRTEIVNLSKRYMQIHLAASVLRKSIERYREQNQAPLLKRASELFQRLTLNSFCGLTTEYLANDQPILVGLRTPDGIGIPTSGMSDGTRDQLYLALRFASIERYLLKNQQMPLILDDILINFDDERSRAALAILGELSQQLQILFLTHHPHLLELAKAEVPKKWLIMHQL
jgi:uncharacterized protein YhaN